MLKASFARIIFPCLLVVHVSKAISQVQVSLTDKLVKVSLQDNRTDPPAGKKLLTFTRKSAYYNPLNYMGAGLLYMYQSIFSEQIQANCMYEISCSEYTKRSISKLGFVSGTLRGFNQITECFDGALYEHPVIFINSRKKIINDVASKAD